MMPQYGYNANNLIKDGKPWFPVMGEMHFSRYKKELWEESLRKMKAGGVTVLSTYVIWIHHEEEEGIFDFHGCRDIRTFMELCKKVGISVFLRLGPFAHGEVRNGGFPDWMMEKEKAGMILRKNDEEYLSYVKRFWTKVYEQVQGYMLSNDGPVIGIQIENEYGHVGGFRGVEGEAHMRTLTAMAKEIGFVVPLYTATGWGGAVIGDLLPVMGGYCEAPWDQRTCEIEPNTNFVFSHTRNDALIACDHHVGDENSYNEDEFPFLTAELGGGIQVTAHRRPVSVGRDVGAMSTVKLGSGAALLGYYMYHGGSNPEGKLSTLQESKATGFLNDLPEINYDFNAPIRQYGTISDSYKEVKLLGYFLEAFGEDMAALKAEVPSKRIVPGDMETIRTTCRHDDTHGYVFFNHYQRRLHMEEHKEIQLEGYLGIFDEDNILTNREKVVFPKMDLKDGMYGFFPYHMKLGDAELISALATPLCRISRDMTDNKVTDTDKNTDKGDVCSKGNRSTYIFYSDQNPEYTWVDGREADVITLSREEALNAWKVTTDREYLVLSDNYVWEEEGEIVVVGGSETEIQVFPEVISGIKGFEKTGENGRFTVYRRICKADSVSVSVKLLEKTEEKTIYEICLSYKDMKDTKIDDGQGKESTNDVEKQQGSTWKYQDSYLYLTYGGEHMDIYMDNKKINDHFYTGQEVPIRLGYFDNPEKITVEIYPLHETDDIFLEKKPEFTDGCACELLDTRIVTLFR